MPPKKYPTNKTMKAMALECVIFFCINSTVGSSTLKDMKLGFDVVINDEAGHAAEPECLIPVNTAQSRGPNRLHVVSVGDYKQLPPVWICQQPVTFMLRRHRDFKFAINFNKMIQSSFERLVDGKRVAHSWLNKQYRMHPFIGMIQMTPTYNHMEHPFVDGFEKPYTNIGNNEVAFAPFTLVDTSVCSSRYQQDNGNGRLCNNLEIEVVENILKGLASVALDQNVRERIVVTSPYLAQVARSQNELNLPGRLLSSKAFTDMYKVDFASTDSMQGDERAIVIVSLARSNSEKKVEFLAEVRRLNVATRREKYCLIIIGDSSTLCQKKCPLFKYFWEDSRKGTHGGRLELVIPSHDVDERQRIDGTLPCVR